MADRLSALLATFSLHSRVYFAGTLLGSVDSAAVPGEGHLHLLRRGRLVCAGPGGQAQTFDRPTLLFFPRADRHRLQATQADGADLVSARVDFGGPRGNPVLAGLPASLAFPLDTLPALAAAVDLLCEEAFAARCGHQAVVDRLAELLVIQLLRHLMQSRTLDRGVMGGLADPRLARAIAAMHGAPGRPWTLDTLAAEAGMSRARFAARFAEVVQTPPGDYLAGWRMTVAQQLLRQGLAVKAVAAEVGYGSAAALSRAFAQRVGQAPAAWAAAQAR